MSYLKKFRLAFAVNLFLCLTAFFFSSMEVYLSNISEFCFPAKHVWRIMLLLAFMIAVFLTATESFLVPQLFTLESSASKVLLMIIPP